MKLSAQGFDQWFEEHAEDLLQPGHSIARVIAVDRGAFLVQDEHGEASAELAGKLRFQVQSIIDLPCVGDWVCVHQHTSESPAIIHTVLPRKTSLRRKYPGKTVDFQMIAANIDVAFVVQSCHYDFNIRRLDRYLVMANEGHIKPFIILSKSDLVTPDELEEMIKTIRHTGISVEIHDLSLKFRFSNCTHTEEPGCAVLMSMENGELSETRYQSYLKLKKETEFNDLSYVEKRKKDRSFGRFIRSGGVGGGRP